MKHILFMLTLVLFACTNNQNGDNSTSPINLVMMFEKGNPGEIDVRIRITVQTDAVGLVPNAAFLSISADFGTLANVTAITVPGSLANEFNFSAILTPPVTDSSGDNWTGEIPVTARYLDPANNLDNSITRITLVLTNILPGLGQPEAVPGLVNTLGVEDSPQVSPDGQWLIVGTYSPVDLGYCLVNGSMPTEAACNNNYFDQSGVERPNMFGANRIINATTIDHAVPAINYDPATFPSPIATPPVASYGFKLFNDNTFGEPFVLGIDAGGYTWQAPFGFSFDSIDGLKARVFYSYNSFNDVPESLNDIYHSDITLGVPNILGDYQNAILMNFTGQEAVINSAPICTTEECEYGNPHITQERLWFDNERQSNDLFFVDVTRDGAGNPTTYSTAQRIPVSQNIRGESMPYMDGDTLYYQCDTSLCRSQLVSPNADPALIASWQTEETVLVGSSSLDWQLNLGRSGRIVATTEPSVATITVNGQFQKWLYFGYLMQIHYGTGATDFGANWNVGRVRLP